MGQNFSSSYSSLAKYPPAISGSGLPHLRRGNVVHHIRIRDLHDLTLPQVRVASIEGYVFPRTSLTHHSVVGCDCPWQSREF